MRVEVCGGIASGKTTLVSVLAGSKHRPIYENFGANPFWRAFYSDPKVFAFETEITFLLQHYHQIKASTPSIDPTACDFSLLLDLAYARVTLLRSKLMVFERVFRETWSELGAPSVVLHLNCDPATELARIRTRERQEEQVLDLGFLDALNRSIDSVLLEFADELSVWAINSATVDFATPGSVQHMVVQDVVRRESAAQERR